VHQAYSAATVTVTGENWPSTVQTLNIYTVNDFIFVGEIFCGFLTFDYILVLCVFVHLDF